MSDGLFPPFVCLPSVNLHISKPPTDNHVYKEVMSVYVTSSYLMLWFGFFISEPLSLLFTSARSLSRIMF